MAAALTQKTDVRRQTWTTDGIGDQACELIHVGQAVMSYGGTFEYFLGAAFNFPSLAEAHRIAALDSIRKLMG